MFDLTINTFIQSIKQKQHEHFGYKPSPLVSIYWWYGSYISTWKWKSNLCKGIRSRWCARADMIIWLDKCHSFALTKSGINSKQFQPRFCVKIDFISYVKENESFRYHFHNKRSNNQHKEDMLYDTKEMMKKNRWTFLLPKKQDPYLLLLYVKISNYLKLDRI